MAILGGYPKAASNSFPNETQQTLGSLKAVTLYVVCVSGYKRINSGGVILNNFNMLNKCVALQSIHKSSR